MLFNQRCYGNSKFKKRDLMDIRDMESPIFTLSPSSTVENPSRFVKERLKLGIASYSSHSASPRGWKIAIPRLSLSFTHWDGFSTVEDGESVKNSYSLHVYRLDQEKHHFFVSEGSLFQRTLLPKVWCRQKFYVEGMIPGHLLSLARVG